MAGKIAVGPMSKLTVLRIVEGHGPAGAVVADVLVVFVAVLVHALTLGSAGVVVAVAVRVDEVGGAEEALKSTVKSGVAEDLVQVRDFGEDVVAGITFGGKESFDLAGGYFGGPRGG